MALSHAPSTGGRDILLKWSSRVAKLAPFFAGTMVGTALLVWTHQFLATFGDSLAVTAGLTMALAAGVACGLWGQTRPRFTSRYSRAVAWLVLSVWTISFPGLLSLSVGVLRWIPNSWLEFGLAAHVIMLMVASGLFIIPVTAATVLGFRTSYASSIRTSTGFPISLRYGLGCGIALGIAPVILAPWASIEQIGFLVTGLAAVAFWIGLVQEPHRGGETPQGPMPAIASGGFLAVLGFAASLLLGVLLPVVERVAMQFLPGSGFAHFAFWSGVICGISGGAAWSWRLARRQHHTTGADGVMTAALIAAVWPVVLLLLCPALLQWNLSLNTNVTSVWLLTAIRWLTLFAASFPLGVAAGRVWSNDGNRPTAGGRTAAFAGSVICLAAGSVLMQLLWVSPQISIVLLAFSATVLLIARLWVREGFVVSRRHLAFASAAVAIIASLPLARHDYRPDLAARLLFSTQTFAAHKAGIDRELLPHLDDGRLVALRDGRHSTWTVWKHRGSQLLLRQDGIPVGIVSTNPGICPHYAADIMPAVVPLVVHPKPSRVLLIGMGSTAALSTCLACPVREVTCVEGDQDLIWINDEVISPAAKYNPLKDDRVRFRNVDPTLAVLCGDDRYDVVIVRESQPYLFRQTSRFTREFYEQVRRRLTADGVVCQRLQYADFGREPIEEILSTMRSAFPQVACLESAPGEMLLLGSMSEEPLVDDGLVKRCEASHIRRLLAHVGWDWSVLLNLAAISPEQVDEIASSKVTINTTRNGRFAYRLPHEVMRCDPKWQEVQRLMAARGSRMLDWLDEEADVQDIAKRLADVTEQQRLIVEHPDHFWAYRKTLKERLKERPRSEIRQVKHELQRTLHVEDQRRKEYLEALGAAAAQTPDADAVAELSDFAEPYDPLVSYFLHQEAARLYERAKTRDRRAEFNHLRYSIHFSPQLDRSVRNVIAALELLISDPELLPDPAERWDEMNALLDVLRQRSSLRLHNDRTASPFELVDAEQSIKIARRAMNVMDDLRPEAEVSAADWEQRRTVLERYLIRPMWSYHAKQAERLATLEARKRQTAETDDDATSTK